MRRSIGASASLLIGLWLLAPGAGAQISPARDAAPTGSTSAGAEAPPSDPKSGAPGPGGEPNAGSPEAKTASGPPPGYYVEPQGAARDPAPYEPPPPAFPVVEPPPPPMPNSSQPRTAFWAGLRLGALVPFGNLWVDGYDYGGGLFYRRRAFTDYASPGPSAQIDIGARVSRRYNVFALWEHTSLGTGSLEPDGRGGQERGATNLYGVGLRFSTDPGKVGFLIEIALGYRDFKAYWSDGTKLAMTDGWLDAHIGLGADIRLTRVFRLSPMLTLGGGSFSSARWDGSGGSHEAANALDGAGQYGTLGFHVGAHADIF